MPASRLPSRTGRFPISFRLLRFAEQRPRHSRLCYSSARPGFSLHCRRMAKLSKAKPSHFVAVPCFAIATHRVGSPSHSLAPPSDAAPLRCLAFQSPCRAEHCLRLATLRFAFATPCSAVPSPRCAPPCLRQALLRKAMPSLPVSAHRRCMPRLCFAVALRRAALRCGAVAARGSSWPSYPMPLRIGSLPVLRGAVRFLAHPSPIAPMLCRRLRATPPCSSLAALDIAMPILRRSRLSRAFPSPHRANQSVSFAESRNAFPSQLSA